MSKFIEPLFDFSGSSPSAVNTGIYPEGYIPHAASRGNHNRLYTKILDEYERCLVEIAQVIGDYDFSSVVYDPNVDQGAADNVGSAIAYLQSLKFDRVSGGSITGPTTFSAGVISEASFTQTGAITATDKGFTTAGRISCRGLDIDWQTGALYRVGDIVVYSKQMYRCSSEHTASGTFVSDISYWVPQSGGGSTTIDVDTYPNTHGLTRGQVIRHSAQDNPTTGYVSAISSSVETLATAMVLVVNSTTNVTLITAGYVDILSSVTDENGDPLDPNTWYYLSFSQAGKLTKQIPALCQPVLYTFGNDPISGVVEEGLLNIPSHPLRAGASKVETFTATAGQTDFTCELTPVYHVVSVGGILQTPILDYVRVGNTISFLSAVPTGLSVRIQYLYTLDQQLGSQIEEAVFIAASGQVAFDLTEEAIYVPTGSSYVNVSVNGELLSSSDFTLDGTDLELDTPLASGEVVRVQSISRMTESGISTSAVGSAQILAGAIDWSHFTSGLVLDTTTPTCSYTVGTGATVAPYDVVEFISGNVYPVAVENFLGSSINQIFPPLEIINGGHVDITPLDKDRLTFATIVSDNKTTTYMGWKYEPDSGYFMYTCLGAGYVDYVDITKSFAVSPTKILTIYRSAYKVLSARHATIPTTGLMITVGSPVDVNNNDGIGWTTDGFQLNDTQSIAITSTIGDTYQMSGWTSLLDHSSTSPVLLDHEIMLPASASEAQIWPSGARLTDSSFITAQYDMEYISWVKFTSSYCAVSYYTITGNSITEQDHLQLDSFSNVEGTYTRSMCNSDKSDRSIAVFNIVSNSGEVSSRIYDISVTESVLANEGCTVYDNTLVGSIDYYAEGLGWMSVRTITPERNYQELIPFSYATGRLVLGDRVRTNGYGATLYMRSNLIAKNYVLSAVCGYRGSVHIGLVLSALPDFHTRPLLGIALTGAAGGGTCEISTFKGVTYIDGLVGLVPGSTYYLSLDGILTTTPMVATDHPHSGQDPVNMRVGTAETATRLKLDMI